MESEPFMTNPLSKHAEMDDVRLQGMISYAQRTYSFLHFTTPGALMHLCRLMIESNFMFDKKPTPIRSSYEFLRRITETNVADKQTGAPMFDERDFIFAIKMFGLRVRNKNGVNQFVPEYASLPENALDPTQNGPKDKDVPIEDTVTAKSLEFYVSDVHKRTKIQTHAIQSATNRLLREWREVELAKLFSDMMQNDGKSIGQAREYLRNECGVKDHEFVRIRKHAIELGIFSSKRNPSRMNRRVTLDEDVVAYVESLSHSLAKKKNPLTPSQAVNQALRDLHKLTMGGPLPRVATKATK